MVIRVALACKDEEYLNRLLLGFDKYRKIDLTMYSDEESLSRELKEKRFDILLFTTDMFSREMDYLNTKADLKILLDDEEKIISNTFSDAKRVKKYQRISKIYKNLLDYYSEVCGKDMTPGEENVKIVSFYSPVGGAGKTTVALVSAEKYAQHGKRTFYISFEDIASEDCYLEQDQEKGLSDLMRFVDSNTNIAMKIEGMLKRKGTNLYYLNHFTSPNDIKELTVEDVQNLISAIRNTGLFDVIVVDMGTALEDKELALFEMSDCVLIVERTDEIATRKINGFYQMYYIMNTYASKMMRIINLDNGITNTINTNISIVGKIGDVQNMDSSNVISVLANSRKNDFLMATIEE